MSARFSCAACDIFGKLAEVTPENAQNVRMIVCDACGRTWFRPSSRSYHWEETIETAQKIVLRSVFTPVVFTGFDVHKVEQ